MASEEVLLVFSLLLKRISLSGSYNLWGVIKKISKKIKKKSKKS